MSLIRSGCGMRPRVQGKFIFVGDEKLYVRGVTYGTFRLDEDGNETHDPRVVEQDFALMAANGLNAIRTYTVPVLVTRRSSAMPSATKSRPLLYAGTVTAAWSSILSDSAGRRKRRTPKVLSHM